MRDFRDAKFTARALRDAVKALEGRRRRPGPEGGPEDWL
jgi:hypothetical protein